MIELIDKKLFDYVPLNETQGYLVDAKADSSKPRKILKILLEHEHQYVIWDVVAETRFFVNKCAKDELTRTLNNVPEKNEEVISEPLYSMPVNKTGEE